MRYRWANYQLDSTARTLERAGKPQRVQALAFDLIALLLRNRGRIVADEVVRRSLWPGVAVSDASLRQVLKEARRAIGDDGRVQKAIKTVRGRGLRFVAALATEGGDAEIFVGREDVLAALELALDDAEQGAGGLTLLSGRPGIGKSSTLVELAARATARGWHVVQAWARAGGEAHAYALWIDVAEALGSSALTRASQETPASSGISDTQRFSRFRALESGLRNAARVRPLLLCFDDLQSADRESLALLRYVASGLRTARVCLVGVHRPLASETWTHDLSTLASESTTRTIELRGLSAIELRAVVAARFGGSLDAEAADALARETHGIPLLALEAVRALVSSGAQLPRVRAPEIAASVGLGLVPLVRRRLAAQSAGARSALHAAVLIGDPFEAALVHDVTRAERGEGARALAEAERSALIEPAGEAKWRFAHPLFAEAVGEDLAMQSAAVQAEVHRRVLAVLDGAREHAPFRSASLAFRGRAFHEPLRVVERLQHAAREAWRMHAPSGAVSWQRRAVEIAEAAGFPSLERCDLLLELGELEAASSGIASARPAFDRAARIAQDARDAVRLSRAALGFAHRTFALASLEPVLSWLRAAHASPCGDDSLEARVAVRLGGELLIANAAERGAAGQLVRDGVAKARATRDALTLGRVLTDHSIASFSAADPRAALRRAQEIASCGRRAGDSEIEFRGYAEIAALRLESGDRAGVDDAFEACQAFVKRVPLPYALGVTHGIDAMRALLDGRFDDAAAAMAAAERYALETNSLGLGVIGALQRFLLARERSGLTDVVSALAKARARFPHVAGLAAVSGLAHALTGNAVAASEAAGALRASLGRLPHDRQRLTVLAAGAELAALVRAPDLARAIEPLLTPFAALHAVVGNAATYWGSVAHALGFVSAAQGHTPEAIAHFERAQRAHEALSSPPWARRSAAAAAELRHGRRLELVS
jgi:DNA-binding winged helix-turn-helix (wHTH) protein